jgi:hypothetical protein
MVLPHLIKVLLSIEIAYLIYVGCNALQNEFSQEFLKDYFKEQRYYEGQERFVEPKHLEALVNNCKLKKGEKNDEAPHVICINNGGVRGVCEDNRVTKDANKVFIDLGKTYSGQEIWEP